MSKAYQVIGWYPNIQPGHRNSTTISDGAKFSTLDLAARYASDRDMTVSSIREYEAPEGDPEIDYYIREGLWTPHEEIA